MTRRLAGALPPAAIAIAAAAIAGCAFTFDHALDWPPSDRTEALLGTWRLVDAEEDVQVEVRRAHAGALAFRLLEDGREDATFLADLLALDSLQMLQVRMETLRRGEDGNERRRRERGRMFFRLAFGPGELVFAAALSDDALAQAAKGKTFRREGEEGGDGVVVAAEILRGCVDQGTAPINPFRELDKAKACVLRRLPGDVLGGLFSAHADAAFPLQGEDVSAWVRESD